ncbi:MAG TPA: hypothetical protein DCQ04_03350 [Actinobacteria bacterium]|nr:hypothetical protein [Actinomycetota bacterium]
MVIDNDVAHKRVEIRDWLTANPRIHVHFTPISGSELNPVEVWFGIIERTPSHPARFLPIRARVERQVPRLHRRLERPQTPVRVDQDSRRHPQEGQPPEHFKHGQLVHGWRIAHRNRSSRRTSNRLDLAEDGDAPARSRRCG